MLSTYRSGLSVQIDGATSEGIWGISENETAKRPVISAMISVIMPAYNAANYIVESIDSILDQTFQDFEFIIVNDGSTDNTNEIIQQYAAQDIRIKILQTDHVGGGAARNVGVELARYDWIATMDADDVALPTRLEKSMKAARQSPEVILWGGYIQNIDAKGQIMGRKYSVINSPSTKAQFHSLRQHGKVIRAPHVTAFFKKEIFLKEGGYQAKFEGAEDMDLIDRMSDHGIVLVLPDVFVQCHIHADSVSYQQYINQAVLSEYIINRRQRLAKGDTSVPDIERFLAEFKRNKIRYLNLYRIALGEHYHRKATYYYGDKRYGYLLPNLLVSFVLTPRFIKQFGERLLDL